MSDSIKKLTQLFSKFPTVGQRTASRFVFYLLKLPPQEIDELAQALQELKRTIKFCAFCFQPFQITSSEILCPICSNPSRNRELLCIVEKETDLFSIENTKKYNGLYFILGGTAVPIKKNFPVSIRTEELKARVMDTSKFGLLASPKFASEGGSTNTFTEIIIATNPTPEGRATSLLVERALKELPNHLFKVTHLAQGLPVGGEMEYADEETLESAFEGRK